MSASRATGAAGKRSAKAAARPRARIGAARRVAAASSPVDVFAALGDGTRLALVECLCTNGVASIAQLTSATTKKFSNLPLDPVANDRVADLAAHRDP